MSDEILLTHSLSFTLADATITEADRMVIECTCGETVFTGPFPVDYGDVAGVIYEHLQEQNSAIVKAMLKKINPFDLLKVVKGLRDS